MRIAAMVARFAKFSVASLASAVLDNVLFYVLQLVLAGVAGAYTPSVSFAAARVCSSAFNFAVNRKAVFKSNGDVKTTMARYYLLAAVQFAVGVALLNIVLLVTGISSASATTAVKVALDVILFLVSFQIQRRWVFKT
jgi:putative flippase GtrA